MTIVKFWKDNYRVIYGLSLSATISFVAFKLSHMPIWPFTIEGGRHPLGLVILSILIGLGVGNAVRLPDIFKIGIKFSVIKLLPVGVILLGARLDFGDLLSVGVTGLLLSACEVVFALAMFYYLTLKLKLDHKQGLLLGVGTAICGGTAIVAIAPIIKAKDNQVIIGVATVTLLGLISMLIMPIIGVHFNLDPKSFGIWTGLTIHQTPQVIAAGFAHSPIAGETATIIKLARVCLLAPVAFLIGLYCQRIDGPKDFTQLSLRQYLSMVPLFVIGFLAMALARTLGFLPQISLPGPASTSIDFSLQSMSITGAKGCLAMAMAGVGLETRFQVLRKTSLKPFLVAAAGTFVIAILGLVAAIMIQ